MRMIDEQNCLTNESMKNRANCLSSRMLYFNKSMHYADQHINDWFNRIPLPIPHQWLVQPNTITNTTSMNGSAEYHYQYHINEWFSRIPLPIPHQWMVQPNTITYTTSMNGSAEYHYKYHINEWFSRIPLQIPHQWFLQDQPSKVAFNYFSS